MTLQSSNSRSTLTHNFICFLVETVFFGIGLGFLHPDSVLPAFASQFTESRTIVGAITAIFYGGWFLPQMVTGNFIKGRSRKKPYMLIGLSGRLLFWIVALVLWLGLGSHSRAILILFFACYTLFRISDGIGSVAWLDILARAIPPAWRGRLFGSAAVMRGLAGLGVGELIRMILKRTSLSFTTNYALLFVLASVAFIPTIIALALIREPAPTEPVESSSQLATAGPLSPLIRDRNFRRWLAARVFGGWVVLSGPFFVTYAVDVLHLPEAVVGNFVGIQMVSNGISSGVLAIILESYAPRTVIRIANSVAMAGSVFVLAVHIFATPWLIQWYPLIYATLGVVAAAGMLGFSNYLLDIPPEGLRPSYIGLANTITGCFAILPIVSGLVLEMTTYTVLFGATAAFEVIGIFFAWSLQRRPQRVTFQAQPGKIRS